MLKGFFDRVFLPGVSFHLGEGGKITPEPSPHPKTGAITTYGRAALGRLPDGRPARASS